MKRFILLFTFSLTACSTNYLNVYHDYTTKNKNIGLINSISDNVRLAYGRHGRYSADIRYAKYFFDDQYWELKELMGESIIGKLNLGQSSIKEVTSVIPNMASKNKYKHQEINKEYIDKLASVEELKNIDLLIILEDGNVILPGTQGAGGIIGELFAKRAHGYGFISTEEFNTVYVAIKAFVVDLKKKQSSAYTYSSNIVALDFNREPTLNELSSLYSEIKKDIKDKIALSKVDVIFKGFSDDKDFVLKNSNKPI